MPDLGPIQVHLMLNHLPVLGVPFGFGLLAFALATRRDERPSAWASVCSSWRRLPPAWST
jgi:hypothetical protein